MNSMQKRMDKIYKSIDGKTKIKYARLKEILQLEDYFFDVVVKEMAEQNNIKIKFIGEYLCMEKGEE